MLKVLSFKICPVLLLLFLLVFIMLLSHNLRVILDWMSSSLLSILWVISESYLLAFVFLFLNELLNFRLFAQPCFHFRFCNKIYIMGVFFDFFQYALLYNGPMILYVVKFERHFLYVGFITYFPGSLFEYL